MDDATPLFTALTGMFGNSKGSIGIGRHVGDVCGHLNRGCGNGTGSNGIAFAPTRRFAVPPLPFVRRREPLDPI
jgi:hypothetical protein